MGGKDGCIKGAGASLLVFYIYLVIFNRESQETLKGDVCGSLVKQYCMFNGCKSNLCVT